MTHSTHTAWLGRQEDVQDPLGHTLARRLAATLGAAAPGEGDALPPLWHWAFFQEPALAGGLGADGHPARGDLLPTAPGRNRMWAGGRLEFGTPLRVGTAARRLSTVERIEEKHGRSGALLFVTVRHDYFQAGILALREWQDIVYREPGPARTGGAPLPAGDWRATVEPTPTLLFRYSAVTFNGHRIHYDWPYATATEGYAGLVVHGPLIATLSLAAFCRAQPQARLQAFAYRGTRPLFAPTPFEVGGRLRSPGRAQLWAGDSAGLAQQAEVRFA